MAVESKIAQEKVRVLADLGQGNEATVVGIADSCTGLERRRLMDMGIVKGTTIACELTSPFGGPVAYRVRGALIGLRSEQSNQILISTNERRENVT